MELYDIKRLALIFAVQAEIEGMKSENTRRGQENWSMTYADSDFFNKAEELRNLAYKCNEQL